jgi:formate hydrogenlyase transcriptional activator
METAMFRSSTARIGPNGISPDNSKPSDSRKLDPLQRELNLSVITQTIPGMLWSATPEGEVDYCNRPWLDFAAMTAEQASGWGWATAIYPADRDGLIECWLSCLASGTPLDVEARMRRFDGAFCWFLFRANPLRDDTGKIVKWYGTNIEIEDRKRAEAMLQARELSWRQIVDNIPGFVYALSATGEPEFINRQTLEYFGRTNEELKDWSRLGIVHPDDLPRAIEALRQAIDAGRSYEIEHRCRRADGVYRWFQVRGCPARNAEGNVTAWYFLITDIDDLKCAEQALRRAQFYLSEGQRLAHTGSWTFSAAGFDYWSPELFQIHGLDPRGKPPTVEQYLDLVYPEDRGFIQQGIKKMVADHLAFDFTKRILRPDGEIRYVRCVGVPLTDGATFQGFVGTAIDVTEQEHLTQSLRRSQHYLAEGQRLSRTGSFSWRVETDEIIWSEQLYRIFEIDEHLPVTLERIGSRVHPEDLPLLQDMLEKARSAANDFEYQHRLLMPDQSVKHIHLFAHATRDQFNRLEYVGAAQDVTDLHTITDAIANPVVVLTPDGTTLYANRVALNQLGLTPTRVTNEGFFAQACHPDDIGQACGDRRAGLAQGAPFELETRLLRNGEYRWQLIQYNPLRDESGKILRWYATTTDIDDRKKMEERLRTENVRLDRERGYLEEQIRSEMGFEQIIGNSSALKQVLELVETVAPSDSTVLLLGETGTGKELIARALHERSRRKAKTFVKLNCAAIPTGLLESELFGHEKGAFTGAIIQKVGRMELADQGTLFLDEVGDIPIDIQPKLLRALQEKEFERLGSTHTRRVNVRLVAATNRNLERMVANREFRSDLFYRLNVFPIRIPPLRDRKDDIPLLVAYFVQKFAKQMQKRIDSIPVATMKALTAWDWPGNIRELENFIERAVILTRGESLAAPLAELRNVTSGEPGQKPVPGEEDDIARIVKQTIAELKNKSQEDDRAKKQHDEIVRVLTECKGRVGGHDGAAARMGLSRTTLISRMKKLGINPYDYAGTPWTN